MTWTIKQRKLGPAGPPHARNRRQRGWDQTYGPDRWAVGYVVEGDFLLREDALESVYYASYQAFFDAHPEIVEILRTTARELHNPHAEHTGGVDLQVWAVQRYLLEHDIALEGSERVDIGSYGNRSHAISARLNPSQIPCCVHPRMSLEKFWQKRKVLAVWDEG